MEPELLEYGIDPKRPPSKFERVSLAVAAVWLAGVAIIWLLVWLGVLRR